MKLTTIVVSLNAKKSLAGTLDSILAQEYGDLEVIAVDGGSTDGTVEILKQYEAKFQGRLQWSSEPDKGIYDAMNKGIAKATGVYVNFLNCGDSYAPQALERVAEQIRLHHDVDVVYGISRYIDSQGEVRLIRENHTRFRERNICHQSIWYRRELFVKHGAYDLKYRFLADYDLNIRLFQAGAVFHPLDAVVANYSLDGVTSSDAHAEEGQKEAMTIFYEHHMVDKAHYDWFMGSFTRRRFFTKLRSMARNAYLFIAKIFHCRLS